ncbi:MAG: Mur ligase family protein [Bacteroidales bacterium]|jgi:dihydrofolate synthase/folylpolyglutamate synthase
MIDQALYDKEIEYIFKQFPSYQKVGKVAYKPGIETMKEFDKVLGYPHKKFHSIHIAGTNGKGSVSHMLAAVLQRTGAKVGLYTSPHLADFRERIKINGEMIDKESVMDFLNKWKPYMLDKKPSFFEITTAMAFDYFAKQSVEIAVIETGLGGRLDSTNVITPLLSIITNIALDHCEHLGFTLGEIAREKAGIIKPGVPVVVGEALPSTKYIFEQFARENSSRLVFAQESLFREILASDYELDLKGDYQTHNIRTVLTSLSLLSENSKFMKVVERGWSDSNIRLALKTAAATTGLRGRWEYLSQNPPVICDTGHNANGLRIVFSQLRRQKANRLFLILGFVAEKDLEKILGLFPKQAYYFFTQAKIDRALDATALAKRALSQGFEGEIKTSVEQAIKDYKNVYKDGDLLFIGGSTFIVAEAIEFFEKNRNFFAN